MSIVITLQPTFQVARTGTYYEFSASATGATGVSWNINGVTASVGSSVFSATAPLTFTGNGDLYQAVFTNGVDLPVGTAQVPLWVVPDYEPATGMYGQGDYGGQPYKSESLGDRRHYYVLKKLWPLKQLDGDTNFEADMTIDGQNLDNAYDSGQALLREVFPDTSELLIADWERILGLSNASLSLPDRQAAAKSQMAARGGLSRAYYIQQAASMGFSGCQIIEGSSLQFIVHSATGSATHLPAPVFSPAVTWTWYLRVPGATGTGSGALLNKMTELRPPWTTVELGVPL